jgi:hypothetical protein
MRRGFLVVGVLSGAMVGSGGHPSSLLLAKASIIIAVVHATALLRIAKVYVDRAMRRDIGKVIAR